MDAHAEVNDHWLPPLLDELERHPNSVIQPFIDGIDAMSLRYTAPTVFHKGSFSWDLRYRAQINQYINRSAIYNLMENYSSNLH
jgi:hypothetical protein